MCLLFCYSRGSFFLLKILTTGNCWRAGPLPKTCVDFWRMVWEQHVLVIVMTTRVMERSRPKCHQYWPEEEISEELLFGPFRITNYSVEKFTDYVITVLQITNLDVSNVGSLHIFQSWTKSTPVVVGTYPIFAEMSRYRWKVKKGGWQRKYEDIWSRDIGFADGSHFEAV